MTKGQRMKSIDDEIARIDSEIERLKVRREAFLDMKTMLVSGAATPSLSQPRKRAANVKPLVLDIMAGAGIAGATSGEVTERVNEKLPTVAKDTVGSVLSRLKADGALVYDGERYYDARYAPSKQDGPPPFSFGSRVVN
jgi:hypothetical protein